MNVWKKVLSGLYKWPLLKKGSIRGAKKPAENQTTEITETLTGPLPGLDPGRKRLPDSFVDEANSHLKALIEDTSIPAAVRAELDAEFREIEAISDKLSKEEIHIAVFGRVGVGKSSLLNALLQKPAFSTSALHGETRQAERAEWRTITEGQVVLIDTPGIDELDGEEREALANRISRRADLVLMVCESDLTANEFEALQQLCKAGKTLILVLNKSDHYSDAERALLMERLAERCSGIISPDRIISASADPRPETVLETDHTGLTQEYTRPVTADTRLLQECLWNILEAEGKSLAALNASLFASELDKQVATRIVAARRKVAERIIDNYCISKGLLVAVNPVPVADLLAAAGTDVAMVIHLGEVYGFSLSRKEASRLVVTISAQLVALMSAYWGVNLVSSALKTASAGLSTTITAVAQGALAWYATYLTGKMAQTWFARGKSWGRRGPRDTAKAILNTLDRNVILATAREDIRRIIRNND
jgi:small GTP-binding protein